MFLVEGTSAVVEIRSTTVEVRKRVADTSANLNGVLIQAGLTLDIVRQSAETQRTYWDNTAQQTSSAIEDFRYVLAHTNANLNEQLIPQATKTLADSSKQMELLVGESVFGIRQGVTDLHELAEGTRPVLEEAQRTLKGTADVTNDPNIAKTLEHLEQTTAHVEKALRPGKLAWRALGWTWSQVAKAFAAFK